MFYGGKDSCRCLEQCLEGFSDYQKRAEKKVKPGSFFGNLVAKVEVIRTGKVSSQKKKNLVLYARNSHEREEVALLFTLALKIY
jgi:hypothetical protein